MDQLYILYSMNTFHITQVCLLLLIALTQPILVSIIDYMHGLILSC